MILKIEIVSSTPQPEIQVAVIINVTETGGDTLHRQLDLLSEHALAVIEPETRTGLGTHGGQAEIHITITVHVTGCQPGK